MIGVLDTKLCNLESLLQAFHRLEIPLCRIQNLREALKLDCRAYVLPGVGAFAAGMASLRNSGLDEVLRDEIRQKGKPLLGICLGLQLLAESSREHGLHEGLGFLSGRVLPLPEEEGERRPHMGWSEVFVRKTGRLFQEDLQDSYYFAHSYFLDGEAHGRAVFRYGSRELPAFVEKDNIFACQFHPEKSQEAGYRLLKRFADLSRT
jgi:glutamine amidotransferase